MKKRLFAMLLPLCCLGFAPAFAQESEEPENEVAAVSPDDEQETPPALYKKGKGGCGCGGK